MEPILIVRSTARPHIRRPVGWLLCLLSTIAVLGLLTSMLAGPHGADASVGLRLESGLAGLDARVVAGDETVLRIGSWLASEADLWIALASFCAAMPWVVIGIGVVLTGEVAPSVGGRAFALWNVGFVIAVFLGGAPLDSFLLTSAVAAAVIGLAHRLLYDSWRGSVFLVAPALYPVLGSLAIADAVSTRLHRSPGSGVGL